ncbi:CotS family spore coat protein [Paenactinomyces guangxiensis]|uniref:CotS family spore coat protein n=1 Tax=Paenactinomyces guangxiensis TaxID=1490290 RepID=A0A7W2AB53_9BACL|nr:CotS family spore coat protein [Paenactinomyces guangxiensis]MBA4496533.1 CotS family spore coat protein [Paenactinomyces guangxiensis]MBH8593658.1 CotS family spore coat protein [Paenactinomyces guangxiensis]
MIDYIIQPWGTAEHDSESIPPEIEELAKHVMARYDMKVKSMLLITSKPDKGGAIWKIETNKGPRSLKILHRLPTRSLFSIGAQEYLVNQGARVPKLIPSKTGQNYVEAGGKLWIVTEWIEPLIQTSKIDVEGAEALCYGLGEFHRHSRGYVPPFGAKHANRLHRYPQTYRKIITKIGWFRVLAKTYFDQPASKTLLSMVDVYEQQAIAALEKLEHSPYASLVSKGELHWGLVHQDYGWSNGQQGPGGIWVIDLDGVAYDLPIRDLRKLITSTMDDMGVWDVNWMRRMIEAYHQANPIDPDLFEILLIDMSLPNEFYKHVKEIVYSPTTLLNQELETLLQRLEKSDATKWPALQELGKNSKIRIITKKRYYSNNIPVKKEIVPDWNTDKKTDRKERSLDRKLAKKERKRVREIDKKERKRIRETNRQNRKIKKKGE